MARYKIDQTGRNEKWTETPCSALMNLDGTVRDLWQTTDPRTDQYTGPP